RGVGPSHAGHPEPDRSLQGPRAVSRRLLPGSGPAAAPDMIRSPSVDPSPDRRPRTMAENTALPLARYTILDLTRARAGPTCVRQLVDWGARAIQIELPGGRDGDGMV